MDELDIDDFRHGGANITGFRFVDPNTPLAKKILSEWSKLNPNDWKGISNAHKIPVCCFFQSVAAYTCTSVLAVQFTYRSFASCIGTNFLLIDFLPFDFLPFDF